MCAKFTGLPAIVYCGLWRLHIFGFLKRDYPDLQIKIAMLLTDEPPGFMITLNKGEYQIEILDEIKTLEDIENLECDTYLVAKKRNILGGPNAMIAGMDDGSIVMKNEKILLEIIGRILEAFGGV